MVSSDSPVGNGPDLVLAVTCCNWVVYFVFGLVEVERRFQLAKNHTFFVIQFVKLFDLVENSRHTT